MLGELCQPTGAGPEFFHKFMMNAASMEMAKSNRRKQSKPNRLFADEEKGTTPALRGESDPHPLAPSMLMPPSQVIARRVVMM